MNPAVCAAIPDEPSVPDSAGIIRPPKGHPAYAGVLAYFGWVEDQAAWGRRGWEIVAIAQERCEERE